MSKEPAAESRSTPSSLIGGGGPAALVARMVPLSRRERTVEDPVSRLLKKLRVSSRAQVLPWVLALGLADLPASAPAPGSPSDGVRQ